MRTADPYPVDLSSDRPSVLHGLAGHTCACESGKATSWLSQLQQSDQRNMVG